MILSLGWALGLLPGLLGSHAAAAQQRNHLGNPSVLKVEGVYYLFKDKAYTWDLYRCDVEARLLKQAR